MPVAMERALKAEAKKKGFKGARADKYVYGTMRKTGWKPSTQHNPVQGPHNVNMGKEMQKTFYKKD